MDSKKKESLINLPNKTFALLFRSTIPSMKKQLILFVILWKNCVITAQIVHSITLGPDLGIPAKNFGSEATLGIGGSLEYQAKFSKRIGAQFHIGYSHFSNKVLSDDEVNFLPVRIGIVGFFYKESLFVSADAGISHYSASVGPSQTGFSFGIGPGYKFYFSHESKQFAQVSMYYNLHNYKEESGGNSYNYNYTWFNIRAAYGFSFR